MRSVVVLPAPLCPMKPNTSPARTAKDTSFTASWLPKRLHRLRISMAFAGSMGIISRKRPTVGHYTDQEPRRRYRADRPAESELAASLVPERLPGVVAADDPGPPAGR